MAPKFRMTTQSYLILLALAAGRSHGYALIQQVKELSQGEVSLGAGTLYGNLDRLLEANFVTLAGQETVDGRARRYYVITGEGEQAARAETARLEQLAKRANRVLGGLPSRLDVSGSPA